MNGSNETALTLPMEISSANLAESFVRERGERAGLDSKILFRLVFVVNEIVAAIVQLSGAVEAKGDIHIDTKAYSGRLTVDISFPDKIPLDPEFDLSDEMLADFPGFKLHPDIFWHHAILKWIDKAIWSKSWKRRTISLVQYARRNAPAGELYFLSLKPKLAEGLKVTHFPDKTTIVKTPAMEKPLLLGAHEDFILGLINGKNYVRDIYFQYIEKFGIIHPQTLGSLIEELMNKGLIVPDAVLLDSSEEEPFLKRISNRIFKLRITIPDADGFVNSVNRRIGFLWSGGAVYVYLLFLISSTALFFYHLPLMKVLAAGFFSRSFLGHAGVWIGFYAGMNMNIIIHELSHAIVCKRFGGGVNEIGLMFYYGIFCGFADTTEAWMFKNKWHRIMVSFAGPFSTLVASFILGLAWLLATHYDFQYLTLVFGAVFFSGLVSFIINLTPFLETDGYYILMDFMELPNLKKKSLSYLFCFVKSMFNRGCNSEASKREIRVYFLYSFLSFISFILIFFFIVQSLLIVQAGHPGVIIRMLSILMIVLVFERLIKFGLSWYKKNYLVPVDLKIERNQSKAKGV